MKNNVFCIVKSFLSAVTIPLWFVKMFKGVGHLPHANGEIHEVIFRHSMFENICDGFSPALPYIAMVVALVSVIANTLALKTSNSKVNTFTNIVFGVTMIAFFTLLLLATTVARGY